ncbi:hypothetical protein A3735_15020 [Oleiphilus sp. HI0061]|uniref:SET domain-containing protein n=1 Tax=Oleiphilus sp. HI0061 TaxID=1822239 RepID=UPI0007CF9367|nr:SET domain-containing protein-lysine N-methyltransferase [Oleiphilus sp. HI0061]KZY59555.1 hypothetical protein A3735_15020 [Oleiphilus sp. HI0061]
MKKLSEQIKIEAKKLKKTTHQHETLKKIRHRLSIESGFKRGYLELLKFEREKEREDRFAKEGIKPSKKTIPLFPVGNGLEVFLNSDGQRGIRALNDYNIGDLLITDYPVFWATLKSVEEDVRMSWKLTAEILAHNRKDFEKFVNEYELRHDLHTPRYDESDRKISSFLSKRTGLENSDIRRIYNIVSTYHCISQIGLIHEETKTYAMGVRSSIIPSLCFFNHSCNPNSQRQTYRTIEEYKSMSEKLIATKEIKKGEEVTWAYSDVLNDSLKNRRKKLKQRFGFQCSCKRCITEQQNKNR